MSSNNYSDDSADFEKFNPKVIASNSFMISLISFLMVFILPLFTVLSAYRVHRHHLLFIRDYFGSSRT